MSQFNIIKVYTIRKCLILKGSFNLGSWKIVEIVKGSQAGIGIEKWGAEATWVANR